jgi:hypothetical protein
MLCESPGPVLAFDSHLLRAQLFSLTASFPACYSGRNLILFDGFQPGVLCEHGREHAGDNGLRKSPCPLLLLALVFN